MDVQAPETIEKVLDYYKVLESNRTASKEDLKRNFQRLALINHPDKISVKNDQFSLVHKAWSVLRDSQSRKEYDASLTCQEHCELLLYDTIPLTSMEYQSSEDIYTYQCRCSGTYVLEKHVLTSDDVIIGCDECSFAIKVMMPSENGS